MKIYVQQPETRFYLCADGTWTEDIKKARVYDSAATAVLDCCTRSDKFQILLKFDDPAYDLTLLDMDFSTGQLVSGNREAEECRSGSGF